MHLMHTQVDSELGRGNHHGAQNASRMAKKWGMAGIVTGTGFSVGFIVMTLVSASFRQ